MVNSFKALLAFIYILTSSGFAQAEVLGLGNPNKNLEFKRYLERTPNVKSLNEIYLARERAKTEKILISKYELAVKGLLLEDLKPSTFVFKEIVSLKNKSFLSKNSTEIILQSHMRLAHLDQENSIFWLKHALFFNPDYKPEDGLFNPVLTAALNKQRQQQNPFLYLLKKSELSDDNTNLYMNGISVKNSAKVHPSGEFNFIFLKDGFEKLEVAVSGEDIMKLKPAKLKPLNLGTCQAPIFKKKYGIQIEKIYFSPDCVKSIREIQEKILASKNSKKPMTIAKTDFTNPRPQKDFKVNFFKRKTTWYIIGAAVATGILVATLSNQNNDPRVIPVER
jgi:hypothetical protein